MGSLGGWEPLLRVTGTSEPDHGQWWHAEAEYGRCGSAMVFRRPIGAGPSVAAAVTALGQRLADLLEL